MNGEGELQEGGFAAEEKKGDEEDVQFRVGKEEAKFS